MTLPILGALCDRTRSRFGHRRVWVVAGVAVLGPSLVLTGNQSTPLGVAGFWALASIGYNMVTSGLTATVADQVPDGQRGMVSGAIYGPQAVGVVVGILAVGGLGTSARYLVLAAGLVAFSLPFVLRHRDVDPARGPAPLSVTAIVRGTWIDPVAHPDFAWAFGSRVLVNLGNAFGTGYLLFFLRDDLRVPDPDGSLLQLTLVYVVCTLVATYVGGILSDRSGRRRVFVAVAAVLQAAAALLLALVPSLGTAMVGAGLLGAGYGAFMSVDQALITAVLPDPGDRAKDLGIMNIGSAAPQALGPLAAGFMITSLGGYPSLFGAAGAVTLCGAAMVYRVRGVR